MAIVNQSRPNTSLSNSSKVSNAETWATIPTTWASETRTWLDCVSLVDNMTRPTTNITNVTRPA